MARTCNSNNDCPQGKKCVQGWCTDTPSGGDGGGPVYTCNNDPSHCPVGTTCQNGTCVATQPTPTCPTGQHMENGLCVNDQSQAPPPPTQTPPPPPSTSGGGSSQQAAPPTCEQVCMPDDPYEPVAGSVPLGFEGYVSSYSPANIQEGIGPGGVNATNQAYLQNYVQQEQAYEADWNNYYAYMHNGGTTPAPVTTQSLQSTVPQYEVQQGDETTPFTQYLQNPYGF